MEHQAEQLQLFWPGSTHAGDDLSQARALLDVTREELAIRSGVPVSLLATIEAGGPRAFADRLAALRALRRLAVPLGLDGDSLVWRALEAWAGELTEDATATCREPLPGPATAATASMPAATAATASVPAATAATSSMPTATAATGWVAAATAAPASMPAATAATGWVAAPTAGEATATLPAGGPSRPSGSPAGRLAAGPGSDASADPGADPRADPPAGPSPASPARPRLLRHAMGGAGTALVVALVLFGIIQVRPDWLALDHDPSVPAAQATPLGMPGHGAGATVRAPVAGGRASRGGDSGPPALVRTAQGPSSATSAVTGSDLTVAVSTSTPCWLEVTKPGTATPVLATVLGADSRRRFSSHRTIHVRVGASGVRLRVRTPAGWTRPIAPPAAPYDFTFVAQSSGLSDPSTA